MAITKQATSIGANSATTNSAYAPRTSTTGFATPGENVLPTGVGFNIDDLKNMVIIDPTTGKVTKNLGFYYEDSITDIILQQNMLGVSTITIQLSDPTRQLLRGGFLQQGMSLAVSTSGGSQTLPIGKSKSTYSTNSSQLSDASLTVNAANKTKTLYYTLTQFVKASDQVQLVFESDAVYNLQQIRGNGSVVSTTGTDVTSFVAGLVKKAPGVTFAANNPDYATTWSELTGNKGVAIVSVALSQGTTADPYEDAWTAASRIASSIGWRIWENGNVVYFGPDEWWQGNLSANGVPPINALKGGVIQEIAEFGETVQLIDFDWDVSKAYGQATVTCMLDNWQFDIGEIVRMKGLGPADQGLWMVSSMQRDAFNPQATVVLTVPMPFGAVYNPTSQPQQPFALPPTKKTLALPEVLVQ